MQLDRLINELYVRLVSLIVFIFKNYHTSLLLPFRTNKELIKENKVCSYNTIYILHEYLVSRHGFIFPVLPMHPEALEHILR